MKRPKRGITKILKLDENNQYGHGMTNPLPTGYIKDNGNISWETFNFLLEKISLKKQLAIYIYSILNLTLKMQLKESLPITKFIGQLLGSKELLILAKSLCFNY